MRKRTVIAAACAATLIGGAVAAPASAAPASVPWSSFGKVTTIASDLLGPLSLAVEKNGTAYVSQSFAGTLERIAPSGERSTVVSAPGQTIGAVSTHRGEVYFAQGVQAEGEFALLRLEPDGEPEELADLGQYEATNNPDQVNRYGFTDLSPECLAEFPPPSDGPPGPDSIPPAVYSGVVDTNAYASAATGNEVYVADAGGNDILRVGLDGTVSTVAVLPPTAPVTVTAELAAQFGAPDCAIGSEYTFEPVPTDIEIGPRGWLYVTTLPGGPEDPRLGARGSVVKINPATGEIVTVASGLAGAAGLAIDRFSGTIAVTELFGGADGTGQVSVILPFTDRAVTSFAVTSPAAIELRNARVYLTYNAAVFGEQGPEPGVLAVASLKGKEHYRMNDSGD
jgi:hypothetical protein